MKAKAKSERAAARQAAATVTGVHSGSHTVPIQTPTSPDAAPAIDEASVEGGSVEPLTQAQIGDETTPNPLPKIPTPDRTELLRSKPVVVGRFMQLMVPILIDVYAASVITPVRVKSLTGLLKSISFLDGDEIKGVLKVCSQFSAAKRSSNGRIVCSDSWFCIVDSVIKRPSVLGNRCTPAC